jgi:phospholipid-binding lipoprotein MlaA
MIARSLSQALVILVLSAMNAGHSTAEEALSGSQVVENTDKKLSESGSAPAPSSSEPGAVAGDDEAADSLFGDEPDPLFDDDFESFVGYPDPYEEPNRAILGFNQGLDRFLLGPIASFFGYVTPNPVKRGLRNFFANLNSPVVLVNDVLQLEWKDAAVCIGAFVVNSTVGLVGFFEPAEHIGLPRHSSDFGQTLALAEVPSGPYLVLPITGPATARGTVGSVVDFFIRPNTWLFPLSNFYYYGGEGVVTLEEHRGELQELERSSVDFYSVLRSAYYQTRDDQIWGRRQDRLPPKGN